MSVYEVLSIAVLSLSMHILYMYMYVLFHRIFYLN